MSVTLDVRLDERFTLRALLDRTRTLTGDDVQMHGSPADTLGLSCGPGVEQPDVILRLMAGDGVADLSWVDTSDQPDPETGVWMAAEATWRNEASILLCACTAVAAAQLGRSVVVDESSLLGHGRLVPPEVLLEALRRAAGETAGEPGSEAYAAAVLTRVRGR
jgi:hypothetical protein